MKRVYFLLSCVLTMFFVSSCQDETTDDQQELELVINSPHQIMNDEELEVSRQIGERLQGFLEMNGDQIVFTAESHLDIGVTAATYESLKSLFSTVNDMRANPESYTGARQEEFFPYWMENQSSRTVFVKPGGCDCSVGVGSGNTYGVVDGVATPISTVHVFKIPDLGRIKVKSNYGVTYNYVTSAAIWAQPHVYGWHTKADFAANGYGAPNYGGWIHLFNSAATF